MALREVLAKFGIEIDDSKLKASALSVDSMATKIKGLAETVLGGSVGEKFKEWTGEVKEQAKTVKILSQRLGVGTQEAQRWTNAATFAGVESETMAGSLLVLQKNIAAASGHAKDAAGGLDAIGDGALEGVLSNKKAQETFKALGVEVKDAAGNMKSVPQIMGDTGLAIAKIKDPSERTATAMKIFGRQGSALLPLFAKGEEGLSGFLDKIDELGGGISEKTFAALKENSIASKEFDAAILGLKSDIVGEVLPAITAKAAALGKLVGWFRVTTKDTNIVRASVLVLSGAMLILQRQAILTGLKTAMAWLPTVLAVGLLVLVIDDLMTAFQGGDSVIGTYGEKLLGIVFGADTASDMVKSLKANVLGLTNAVGAQDTIGGKISEVFSRIGADLVKFIVEDLPEFAGMMATELGTLASSLADSAKSAADGLIDGLVGGLKAGISKVQSAVSDLGAGVVAKLRSVFDWHSPAGVTMDLGFEGLDMGLVKGMVKGIPMIENAADKTFGSAIPGDFGVGVGPSPGAGLGGGTVHVDQHNEITQTFPNSADPSTLRDTVRRGTVDGVGDLRADLSALEAQA